MDCLDTPPIPVDRQSVNMDELETYYMPAEVYYFLTRRKKRIKGQLIKKGIKYQLATLEVARYMESLYEKRLEIKRKQVITGEITQEEKDRDKQLKVAMNSIYGKLCQRTFQADTIYRKGKFETDHLEGVELRSCMTGLYVAWMGRLILYEHIVKVIDKKFTFLYCDTDSIKFAAGNRTTLPLIFDLSATRLGAWKDEGQFDEFCCNKRKKYALINYRKPEESKFALSGINGTLKIPDILTKYLKDPTKRGETLEHIRKIFSPFHNVVIKNGKTVKVLTEKFDQTVIKTTDFNTNPELKKETIAIMEVDPEGLEYRWRWLDRDGKE